MPKLIGSASTSTAIVISTSKTLEFLFCYNLILQTKHIVKNQRKSVSMKKKITAFIMSVCLVAAMIADPVQAASKKAYIKTGVSSKVTVLCGKTVNLKAKTVNKKKKITYKSSKKSVATVSSKGIVKGKKYGTAVITLRASGMSAKKVKVYVRKPVTSIKLTSKSSLKLGKGKTSQIKTKVYPGGKQMVNAKLYYKSSNTKVATVSSTGNDQWKYFWCTNLP